MANATQDHEFDVVVVGSGAGALAAALRAHELGLSTVVVEKAPQFGGTSAISGGCLWVPMNAGVPEDTAEEAMRYLLGIIGPDADEAALRTFVARAAPTIKHLETYGVKFQAVIGYPDYYSDAPGATISRTLAPENMDGALLGDEFFHMRDNNSMFLGLNRYALDFPTAGTLMGKMPGWRRTLLNVLMDYWLDIPWRRKTRRDRRLVLGRALMGMLRKAMLDRNIPLWLNTGLVDLEKQGDRVTAAICSRHGNRIRIAARGGIILGAGGFEQNQDMRERHLPIPPANGTSITPPGWNTGDAIRIGAKAGGAVGGMDQAWWAPCIRLPLRHAPNVDATFGLIFERGRPGSLVVNRRGERYTNEAASYDRFGLAMIEEEKRTGAANPSWMIFDSEFRRASPVGAMPPGWVTSDREVPGEWWDSIIYRADTLAELAQKIEVPVEPLLATIKEMNADAHKGVDTKFGRGSFAYDQFLSQYGYTPNANFGPVETGPFYAVPVQLGDLGTKGGLKVDVNAAVVDEAGTPVAGLYAIGNTTCSLFGKTYPGAGGALAPPVTFGFVAAEHIASQAGASFPARGSAELAEAR